MYGLSLQTAATTEPLTLAEAKRHCNIADELDAHDTYLTALTVAAREYVEAYTGRQLINATWDLVLDRFPVYGPIYLPKSPLSSITSITYLDADGASQTWSSANYRVITSTEPGTVNLAYQVTYPTTRNVAGCVTVRFVAGYGSTAASVPKAVKQAMLLLVGHWFANREALGNVGGMVEMAVESLLAMYRVGDEFTCYAPASYVTSST